MFSLDSTDTELHFSEGNQNKYNVPERKIIADKITLEYLLLAKHVERTFLKHIYILFMRQFEKKIKTTITSHFFVPVL